MADPTADVALESRLYNNIRALFQEMNSSRSSQKGMLRWNLQKTVETHPSCSLLLIQTLVEELQNKTEQIHKSRSFTHILPVLHTLHYAVLQSGAVIPMSLYQTVYERLMKLLILPLPYSAVALSTLKSVKMEMTTPGFLYQRRLVAEQNLKNEHLRLQERVFVLADPAVLSAPLEATLRAELEAVDSLRDAPTQKRSLVLRLLQTGLGSACQSSRLVQALGLIEVMRRGQVFVEEALEDHSVEKYFQEVVLAAEQSVKHGEGGCADYINKLQRIYTNILTASTEVITTNDDFSECSAAMPCPEINFHLWGEEEDLWNLLANFTLCSSSNSSLDGEEKEKRDSGIERDLKEGDMEEPSLGNPNPSITRRNAFKNAKLGNKLSLVKDKIKAFPGSSPVLKEECGHTAKVVAMGDDRVLGRLARAYHSIRDKESKRIILTKKLNLQLYYIPVTDVEPLLSSTDGPCQEEGRLSLASLLGRADPWYDSNINILQTAIPKLHETHSNRSRPSQQNHFLLDTLCHYIRCGMQPVNLPLYTVKMTRCSRDVSSVVEEVFVSNLEAHIPEFRYLKERKESSAHKKKSTEEVFGGIISVSYTKISVSKREVVKGAVSMTCGVMITSEPAVTSGEDYLTVRFDSVDNVNNTEIRTKSINIKTMEHRTLAVCLDKDSQRTYTDVQRIEICPCLDPGCSIQSRFRVSRDKELPLSKYLDNVLSLPINTFTGVAL